MRLLDKTWLTVDEGWNLPGKAGELVEAAMKELALDSYNEQYVVRVTVDKVDEPPEAEDDDVEA